jgi:hypothetical protein
MKNKVAFGMEVYVCISYVMYFKVSYLKGKCLCGCKFDTVLYSYKVCNL